MQNISLIKNSFKNRAYNKHFHSTYSISLITKGSCNFQNNRLRYNASKGMVRVINPYEMHEIYSSSWEHINLVLSAYLVRLISKDFKDNRLYFKTIIQDSKLSLDLQNLYAKKSFIDEEVKHIVKYMLLNYSGSNQNADALHAEKFELQKAIEYIYQNANNKNLALDEIASFVGLSKYHFLRIFKQHFGLTPYKFIQNIKINNARRMLCSDIPLSQIAQECGFYDQSHLIKSYKNFYGHTPSKIITK
ncbi:MAG: AraC family transcriptional regulator [Sulfurospirillum sp.]